MPTLYLLETRAAKDYTCPACERTISRGAAHFRHDPHPYAQMFRGQKYTHWCYECIMAAEPEPKNAITRRIFIPQARVLASVSTRRSGDTSLLGPLRVGLIGIGRALSERLLADAELVHTLSPEQFEEFICDRLFAMGLEPQRVGSINSKDGGVDILFWPRNKSAFPFLGAAQVKHHRDPRRSEGPSIVREFAGAIAGQPFNAGMIVTNTSFSPDAEWYARERARLIRLRGYKDIQRWIAGRFADEAEWREMPSSIELCPGVVVRIK